MRSLKQIVERSRDQNSSTEAVSGSNNRLRSAPANFSPAHDHHEVADEKTFLKLLSIERKRTERSGRRFVLMLIEPGLLIKTDDNHLARKTFIDALSRAVRETDIKGWYKQLFVFGVIFTEIGDADGKAITKVLLEKVTGAIVQSFAITNINQIRISFHVYPDEHTKGQIGRSPDLKLFPDQTIHSEGKLLSHGLKLAIDRVGSLIALILLFPLFAVIAAAIRVTSKGPVLFRQQRVGSNGVPFTFLKFRSMYVANDETIHKEYIAKFISGQSDDAVGTNGSIFKLVKDPRVTRLGRLIRKTSLDELPQLINVLRGEMSLVGPRPPLPYEFDRYETWHKRRLMIVKPGITGLWQVSGRSKLKFNDMVRLDLKYASQWSLRLDLKILLSTPHAVLSGDGAY